MGIIEAGTVVVADDGTITKSGMAALYYDAIYAQELAGTSRRRNPNYPATSAQEYTESPLLPDRNNPPSTWVGDPGTWTKRIDEAMINIKRGWARQAIALSLGRRPPQSWVDRCFSGAGTSWLAAAGDFTIAVRYRLKVNRPIFGIRFGWKAAGALSVKTSLWKETGSLLMATGTIAVENTGIYSCMFDAPITADLTGSDITCAIYCSTFNSYSTDATWNGLVPFELDDVLTVKHLNVGGVGDVQPLVNGAGTAYVIEPIL